MTGLSVPLMVLLSKEDARFQIQMAWEPPKNIKIPLKKFRVLKLLPNYLANSERCEKTLAQYQRFLFPRTVKLAFPKRV